MVDMRGFAEELRYKCKAVNISRYQSAGRNAPGYNRFHCKLYMSKVSLASAEYPFREIRVALSRT